MISAMDVLKICEEWKSETVNLHQLYHGTGPRFGGDKLTKLVNRPVKDFDTFGTWLADFDSAKQYGPILYKVETDKEVKLASFYDIDEMFAEVVPARKVVYNKNNVPKGSIYFANPILLNEIKSALQAKGFNGFKLTELDGIMGVFVCLWHNYDIEITKVSG